MRCIWSAIHGPWFFLRGITHNRPASGEPGRKRQDMKYILSLLTIALFCTATTVSAAFTYEVVPTQYTNANGEGFLGQYFTVRITGGTGKLYITDFFNNTGSNAQSEVLTAPGMGITEYGYYDVHDATHQLHSSAITEGITELNSYTVYPNGPNEPGVPYYRNGYELGTFSAGREVEIYLATATDALSSNTPRADYDPNNPSKASMYISTYNTRIDALSHESMRVGSLYLDGIQVNFGIVAVGIDSIIPGDDDGPFGSPLPGKLAIALVSVCFALGFWYIRRKKAVAA